MDIRKAGGFGLVIGIWAGFCFIWGSGIKDESLSIRCARLLACFVD